MLDKILERLKARREFAVLQKHPVFRAAIIAVRETMLDDSVGLGKHASQKFKEQLADRLSREVAAVVATENPIMANREKLSEYVITMAKYQVLVLASPSEPEEEVTGLRGRPGISGELKAHLREIAEKDKDIREFAWSLDNPEDLYDACLFRCWTATFLANGFNRTRIALGDHHPSREKDWFCPFIEAMCTWEEYGYRKAIGLPDILATQTGYGPVAGIRYMSFFLGVMEGAQYPNFDWEEHWKPEHG